MTSSIAVALSVGGWELAGLFSAMVTLAGVWLRWRSQWHISEIEDEVKNGKISGDEAQRRMRFIERRAMTMIFGGLGLLVFVLFVLTV